MPFDMLVQLTPPSMVFKKVKYPATYPVVALEK
jgi:hypothetical protein